MWWILTPFNTTSSVNIPHLFLFKANQLFFRISNCKTISYWKSSQILVWLHCDILWLITREATAAFTLLRFQSGVKLLTNVHKGPVMMKCLSCWCILNANCATLCILREHFFLKTRMAHGEQINGTQLTLQGMLALWRIHANNWLALITCPEQKNFVYAKSRLSLHKHNRKWPGESSGVR